MFAESVCEARTLLDLSCYSSLFFVSTQLRAPSNDQYSSFTPAASP